MLALILTAAAVPLASALALRDVSAPYSFPSLKGCPVATEYSCENTTAVKNTCCTSTPGGLVLVTSFWNTYTNMESSGQFLPARHWGMHGLWPDFCDGTYPEYCGDSSRFLYEGASPPNDTAPDAETAEAILERFGRKDLKNYMDGYWVNRGAPSSELWAHEYSKHATCMSTFDVECTTRAPGSDVISYFEAAIRAHKMYPTFDILASAGILPSNSTTYQLADLNAAWQAQVGALPYFGCVADENGDRTVLTEMWAYNHVLGTPSFGNYKPVDTTFPSTCSNSTGIHYYERSVGSEVSKYS